jgi:hypothetical protein
MTLKRMDEDGGGRAGGQEAAAVVVVVVEEEEEEKGGRKSHISFSLIINVTTFSTMVLRCFLRGMANSNSIVDGTGWRKSAILGIWFGGDKVNGWAAGSGGAGWDVRNFGGEPSGHLEQHCCQLRLRVHEADVEAGSYISPQDPIPPKKTRADDAGKQNTFLHRLRDIRKSVSIQASQHSGAESSREEWTGL